MKLSSTTGIHLPGDAKPIRAGLDLPGMVAFFAMAVPPAGWIKAEGQAVSRTIYADLFEAIGTLYGAGDGSTTFTLPDLRGEFIRGLDSARGVDAGRALGSSQDDAMATHTHDVTANNTLGVTSTNNYRVTDKTTSAQTETGGETRPRNVALLACIKY